MSKFSKKQKLDILDNLLTLLSSGVDLASSVELLVEESSGQSKKVALKMQKGVSEGKKLWQIFKEANFLYPIELGAIKAGEESGDLNEALTNVTKHIKKNQKFVQNVKSALYYPLVVITLFIFVFYIMLGFVMPRIETVFSSLGAQVVFPTNVLFWLSNLMLNSPYLFFGVQLVLILTILLIFVFNKSKLFSYLYYVPLINKLLINIDLANFSNSLGLMLKSGVPINEALTYSKSVVSSETFKRQIEQVLKQVSEGSSLSTALKRKNKVFPKSYMIIVNSGEKSGKLQTVLLKLSKNYETEVNKMLKSITTLIEPVLLVVLGVFIGAVMLSIITPIYNLLGNINAYQ